MSRPTAEQLRQELLRLEQEGKGSGKLYRSVGALIVFAAVAALVLTLWVHVFQVQRSSMSPALIDGDIAVFVSIGGIGRGDVVAFHHGSQVLIKRVIAIGGDWVDISGDGTVLLNNEPLDEPYINELTPGETGVTFPMQVLDRHFFVLSDERDSHIDSRNEEIGLIREDQIIGNAMIRAWPLNRIGLIS